jgi:DNA repair protein RAD16
MDSLHRIWADDAFDKVVVFSQWTSMLDIIESHLQGFNFQYVRLDGSQSLRERDEVIKRFKKEKDIKVFLISLKCGGVGLNLTEANHVFLMDVWWNPQIEEQAFDRVYRIGQKKDVHVHRVVIENSIETRILELQKRKKVIADETLRSCKDKISSLGKDDLAFLLQNTNQ